MEAKAIAAIILAAAAIIAAAALAPGFLAKEKPGATTTPVPGQPPSTWGEEPVTTSTVAATTTSTATSGEEFCEPVPDWAGNGIEAYTLWMNTSTGEVAGTLVACNGTKYYFSHVTLRISINGSLGNGTWTIDASATPLVRHVFYALDPDTLKPVDVGTYTFTLYDYKVAGSSGGGELKLYAPSSIGDWIQGEDLCTVLAVDPMAVGIGVVSAGGYTGTSYNYRAVPVHEEKIYGSYMTEDFDKALEKFVEATPLALWEKYFPPDATLYCFTYPYAIWEEFNVIVSEHFNNDHLASSPEGEDIIATVHGPFKAEIAGVELPFFNISFKDYYLATGERQLLVEGYAVASPYSTMPLKYYAKFYAPNFVSDVEVTIELVDAEATPLE